MVSPRYSDAREADPEWRSLRIDADVVSPRHGRQCRSLETATASATTFSRSLLPRGRGAPKNVTRLWQTSSEPHGRYQHRFWPTPRRGGDRRLRFALDASYFTVPDESTLARNLTTNDRIGFSECGGAHAVMGQGRGVAGGLRSELTDLIKELAASRSSPRRPRSTASATRPGRPARHRRPPTNRRPGRVSFPAPRWRVDLHGAEEVR